MDQINCYLINKGSDPNSTVIFSLSPCIMSENDVHAEIITIEVIQSESSTCYLFH